MSTLEMEAVASSTEPVTFDSSAPLPATKRSRKGRWDVLAKMKVGENYTVTTNGNDDELKKVSSAIAAINSRMKKSGETLRYVVGRVTSTDIRVWREK